MKKVPGICKCSRNVDCFSNFLKFRRNSAEFSGENMRFEPVLGKIWRNLERSPRFFKVCENLENVEFEAVQRYDNLVDLEKY